jgi:hypothetical protein
MQARGLRDNEDARTKGQGKRGVGSEGAGINAMETRGCGGWKAATPTTRARVCVGGGGYIKRASKIMRGGPVPTFPERFWIGVGVDLWCL